MTMKIEQELIEKYPGPWKVEVSVDKKKGTARVWLLDYNGNHIATVHGETRAEAEAIANCLTCLPELIFEKINA